MTVKYAYKLLLMTLLSTGTSGCFFIKASNPDPVDSFGKSIALNDDLLVVGAPHEDGGDNRINGNQSDNSALNAGAAYIYRISSTGITQTAYLKPSMIRGMLFSYANPDISADSKRVVVSASEDWDPSSSGSAYVFEDLGMDNWVEQARITPAIVDPEDLFGATVAISGDGQVLAIGAPLNDSGSFWDETDNSVTNAGAAYAFRYNNTTGAWQQEAFLKPKYPGASDFFGLSVDISGNGRAIIVGAPREESALPDTPYDNSCSDCGAAYIFENTTGLGWETAIYLKAPVPTANETFGAAVAVTDDGLWAAVGAPSFPVAGGSSPKVYIFKKIGSRHWVHQQTLQPSNLQVGQDAFGDDLDFSPGGRYLVVGDRTETGSGTGIDPLDDNSAAHSRSGAVYLFEFDGTEYRQKHYIKHAVSETDDFAGSSVAISGGKLAFGIPREDSRDSSDLTDNSVESSGAAVVIDLVDDLGLSPDH